MKFYKKANGKWQIDRVTIPSGTCIEIVSEGTGRITIQDLDGSVYANSVLPTEFENEAGVKYVSDEAYEAATADFFVKAPTYGGKPLIPYYVDLDFPIIIRSAGLGIPTLETLVGNITAPQWQVNDFNMCEGQEMIHAWKESSEIFWHIHLLTNGVDANDRFVKFEIEFCHANVNGVLSEVKTVANEFNIPAGTPDRTMMIVSIGSYVYTGGKIASHIWPRLKRIASTGAAPTNNPFCTMLQAHILCDSVGSEKITTK